MNNKSDILLLTSNDKWVQFDDLGFFGPRVASQVTLSRINI